MPKIVINEYDLTKAGTSEYENFAVVVPGFVGENCDDTVFDENGIYECSSQTDFKNYIGKRSAEVVTSKILVNAIAPTVDFAISYCPDNVDGRVEIKDSTDKIVEYQYNDSTAYDAAFLSLLNGTFEGLANNSNYGVYYAIENNTGKIGHLRDETKQYVEASSATQLENAHTLLPTVNEETNTLNIAPLLATEHPKYYVINGDEEDDEGEVTTCNQGQNGSYIEDRITHYGNQMAYELLGLGYTVLFKRMSEHEERKLEDIITKAEEGEEDAFELSEDGSTQILKPKYSAAICELADPNFWYCLRDKSTYDFRYLVTGLLTNNDGANEAIKSIAEPHNPKMVPFDDVSPTDHGRGDCIALIDIDCAAYKHRTQTDAIPYIAKEANKWSSAYAAVFAPYVSYILADDAEYKNNKVFPASFHYLACAANSANNNFSEWYANAGYTRGVSKYTIEYTGCKLGEIAVQSLEPRFTLKVGRELLTKKDEKGKDILTADGEKVYESPRQLVDINTTVAVNLIIKIKNSYYLWGNRTGKELGARYTKDGDLKAQHFLNIRQLCTTIKKQVYITCRRLTFDPNSNILWINFRSLLSPILEQMKADQGIRDYEFVRDFTDRKALLKARIRIVPIEAVEDFEIGLYLEDSLEDVVLTEA